MLWYWAILPGTVKGDFLMSNCAKKQKKILESLKDFKLPGADGVMPIAGYFGPHLSFNYEKYGVVTPNYVEDKYFQMIEDAGINLINYTEHNYANNPRVYHEILKLAEDHNIGIYVRDTAINGDMTDEEFEERIKLYSGYKSFAGIYVADEPSTEYFPRKLEGFDQTLTRRFMNWYSPTSVKVNSFENMFGYSNLLPRYFWMESTVEDYDRYVKEYCETFDAKMISWDHYVFCVLYEGHTFEAFRYYFQNFSIIYKYAKMYNLPLWAFIQSGGNWDHYKQDIECYYPNGEETLWMVNISLAYGAKAIQYYPLLVTQTGATRPDGSYDNDRIGMIGPDGKPTRYWAYAKSANEQVAVVDEILLQCDSEGLICTGKFADFTKELPEYIDSFRELESVTAEEDGATVGCFDFGGKTALYVVNNDMAKRQKITLNFDKEHQLSMLAVGCNRTEKAESYTFDLQAGAAVLIVID